MFQTLFLSCFFSISFLFSMNNKEKYANIVRYIAQQTLAPFVDDQWQALDPLLENYDLNFQEPAHGYSVLMIAAKENQLAIVNRLLEKNANPNLKMFFGTTAYDWAFENQNEDIKASLIQHGAILAPKE